MAERTKRNEVFADLLEGGRKLISRLREDVDEISTKGKMRLEVISLKNKRARLFRELGMRTYVLLKNKKHAIPEVKSLVGDLTRLEEQIDIQEGELQEYARQFEERTTKEPAKTAVKPTARPRRRPRRREEGTDDEKS